MDNLTSNNNPNFYWWFGVVEDRNDPLRLGRCRVRILGYHTADTELLPTGNLPWAIPVMPANSAGTSGVGWSPTGAVEGSWVVGFFADGENGQHPMFFGTVGSIPGGLRANDCSPTEGSGSSNDQAAGDGTPGTGGVSVDLQNISADGKDRESFLEEYLDATAELIPNYSKVAKANIMGQCAHETGNFRVFSENLNYSAEGLMNTFRIFRGNPTLAEQYARQPEKIANRAYANRMSNGPESSGDGWKYRGRGYIQLTGKSNYRAFDVWSQNKFNAVQNPDILATNKEAAAAAVVYYFASKLAGGYMAASKNQWDSANAISLAINQGERNLAKRSQKVQHYRKTYGV